MEVFNLDIIPGKAMPVIHCSQFDKGRAFRANLFERGAVYILNGAETLSIIEKKSDGNMVTISVTNTSDSFIEFEITEQMSAIAGPQLCELRIEEGGNVIGSLNFALDCEASPDTGIESDSAIHNLEEQIAEAVADQYDADSVVFDAAPTAGHGVGFAVTSEGILNAIPDELNDLSDVDINSAAVGEALVWNGAEWVNGTPDMDVSDLADVTITTPSNDDILVYQNGEWVNMANPASTANFADAYDPTATYNTGDVCIYNNVLYICTEDNITGTFDPSKWTATTIDNVIGSLSTLTTTDKSSIVGAVNEVVGKDISSSITLNTTKFTLETWGYINAFEHSGYIFVDFAGVKTTSAIGENWTDVFTITKNATKKSRLIVYEQISGGNTTAFSEIRIESGTDNVQVYACPNNYWLAGQMWIRTV